MAPPQRQTSNRSASASHCSMPSDSGRPGLDDETFAAVRRAVRALPARYREVVVLRYLEEQSIDEVSRALGASKNAVEVRLHRARARLKDALADLVGV